MASSGQASRASTSAAGQASRDTNANKVDLFRPQIVQLKERIDELLCGFDKPKEFEKISSQIVGHFTKFQGRNLDKEPITFKEIDKLTDLLVSFQDMTDNYNYNQTPEQELSVSDSVDSNQNQTQDLAVRQKKTIIELTDVVEKGSILVGAQAVLKGYNVTPTLELELDDVASFRKIVKSGGKLLEQASYGMAKRAAKDPEQDINIGHEGLMQLLGNKSILDIDFGNMEEERGDGSFAGAKPGKFDR